MAKDEPQTTFDFVWIISWRYSDGSASGVLRAYASEQRAKYDMDLLDGEPSSKDYELVEIPIYR